VSWLRATVIRPTPPPGLIHVGTRSGLKGSHNRERPMPGGASRLDFFFLGGRLGGRGGPSLFSWGRGSVSYCSEPPGQAAVARGCTLHVGHESSESHERLPKALSEVSKSPRLTNKTTRRSSLFPFKKFDKGCLLAPIAVYASHFLRYNYFTKKNVGRAVSRGWGFVVGAINRIGTALKGVDRTARPGLHHGRRRTVLAVTAWQRNGVTKCLALTGSCWTEANVGMGLGSFAPQPSPASTVRAQSWMRPGFRRVPSSNLQSVKSVDFAPRQTIPYLHGLTNGFR